MPLLAPLLLLTLQLKALPFHVPRLSTVITSDPTTHATTTRVTSTTRSTTRSTRFFHCIDVHRSVTMIVSTTMVTLVVVVLVLVVIVTTMALVTTMSNPILPVKHQRSISSFSKQHSVLQSGRTLQQHLLPHSILQTFQEVKQRSTIIKPVVTKFQLHTPKLVCITLHTCQLPQRLQLSTQFQLTIYILKLLNQVGLQFFKL